MFNEIDKVYENELSVAYAMSMMSNMEKKEKKNKNQITLTFFGLLWTFFSFVCFS